MNNLFIADCMLRLEFRWFEIFFPKNTQVLRITLL